MSRILVIEDEDTVRANLIELLNIEGFQVIEATNGTIGVRLAQEHLPDVILCDIMMPELDGYGVLDALRQDPATALIPFVFLTARADRVDVRQGMNLGADDYLTKPCTHEELLNALSTRVAKQAAVAHRADAKLNEFRGLVSIGLPHELRTPLTSLMGFAESLSEDSASLRPETIREIAQGILSSAKRLHELVSNSLLYSELEIAARDPTYARVLVGDYSCRIEPAVQTVAVHEAQQALRQTDLQIELVDATVRAASDYLEKVIRELVRNAFKFSAAGTPVRVTGHPDAHMYALSIQDHGRGMTHQQVADVGAYQQFERQRYEQQGAGLGLAIAMRIVQLHGGDLVIDSVYGQGTAVNVLLPVSGEEITR